MTSLDELYAVYRQHRMVRTDTRTLHAGDLFFALKGEHFNGNAFAQQAIDAGAAYAVIDEAEYEIPGKTLLVPDVLRALQDLAGHHRSQFKIPFLAITGSNGKTTTKELIHAVLSRRFRTTATVGNLNNHIGIPLTILSIPDDAEIAIIEMGANHQQEIAGYCTYTRPTHALITNCGKAHLEGFGGEEGVRRGKGELYDFMREHGGSIFRNTDLPYLDDMAEGVYEQITYGGQGAKYSGILKDHPEFLAVAITTPGLEGTIQTRLVGDYNFANVMAAVAVAYHFGVPFNEIREAIEAYTPGNSRSQLIRLGSNHIILDAYNANPSSMAAAIRNFRQSSYPNRVIMLGAMKELGPASVAEHQGVIDLLQESNWNEVVLVGGDFAACKHRYTYLANAEDASAWFKGKAFERTAILIKGSRAIGMEKVLQ